MPPRDRPVTDEIEITPAMIEAGKKEYGLFDADDRAEWVICAVYRAMAAVDDSRHVELIGDNAGSFTDIR